MPIKITNKTSGLGISVSRVKNFLRDRAPGLRISSDAALNLSIAINYMIKQLVYLTDDRMLKNTTRGSDKPKRLMLTREELVKTIRSYSLFSDFQRKAAPVGGLPIGNAITFPSAERLKGMTPYQRNKFYHAFNYKAPEFDEAYFEDLRHDEQAMEVDTDLMEEHALGTQVEDDDGDEDMVLSENEDEDEEDEDTGAAKRRKGKGKGKAAPAKKTQPKRNQKTKNAAAKEVEESSDSGSGEESSSSSEPSSSSEDQDDNAPAPRKRTRAAAKAAAGAEPAKKKART